MPKQFEAVYRDTEEDLQFSEVVVDVVIQLIKQIKEILKDMKDEKGFDFHGCFYYRQDECAKRGHFCTH